MFWKKNKESYEEKVARLEKERAELGEKLKQQTKVNELEKDIQRIKVAQNRSTPLGRNLMGVKEGLQNLSKKVSQPPQKTVNAKPYNPLDSFGGMGIGQPTKTVQVKTTAPKKRYAYVQVGKNKYAKVKLPDVKKTQQVVKQQPVDPLGGWKYNFASPQQTTKKQKLKKIENPLDSWKL